MPILACGEFGHGILINLFPPKPIPTPVADPGDARLLENGLSVAVNANQGRHLYSRQSEDQITGRTGPGDAWITHTFGENEVTVEFDHGSTVSYTKVETNVYQDQYSNSLCSDGTSTLTYNKQGFTIYLRCNQEERTSLFMYELLSTEE
ncbi:MAG: hypothetical protein GY832_19695 [Chloroflexi bacterium]|nr:hypothetical protein [Chloroflexota bacterium]